MWQDIDLGSYVARKSPSMIVTIFVLWAVALIYFGPPVWQLVTTGKTILETVVLSLYGGMLIIFWLLASSYISVVLFSLRTKPVPPAHNIGRGKQPTVAILYPTCNDFNIESAISCLIQDYPNFHLFILDDSTKDEFHEEIEAFHTAHADVTTIIRRSTREGFKAGNLNHGLRKISGMFPFFAIVDSDEKLPVDFLSRTVPYLQHSNLAFVQANHSPNKWQESTFARDIAPTILPFWHIHCRPRNRYGFVVFLGHGALVRRSAWEVVEGFPEVASEDLAFSIVLAEKGMRGVFLQDLVCYEDFASSYTAFRKQQERYIVGTLQVMRKYLGSMLRSNKISLIEKLDIFLWCSPLCVPGLALLFIAVSTIGLPILFGSWQTPEVMVMGREFYLPTIKVLDSRFSLLYPLDFQIFSVFCTLSPCFAAMFLGFKRRLPFVKVTTFSTIAYLSLMVIAWTGSLGYLFSGRARFKPTGELEAPLNNNNNKRNNNYSYTANLGQGLPMKQPKVSRAITAWEIVIGAGLAATSLICLNLAAFALSSCLVLGVGVRSLGWSNLLIRLGAVGCFTLIILQMVINIGLPSLSIGLSPLIFTVWW